MKKMTPAMKKAEMATSTGKTGAFENSAFIFVSAVLEMVSLDNIPLWPGNFFQDRS